MEVVVANARRALLLVLLRVRVKVGGFDSWLLGDAIGDDEALDAATRMDKQIAVSVLLFIGTVGGELAVGFWSSVRIRRSECQDPSACVRRWRPTDQSSRCRVRLSVASI